MKHIKNFLAVAVVLSACVYGCNSNKNDAPRYRLCYLSPAGEWMTDCLPIGNGTFGAMISGGTLTDEIQFNDKTLWTGDKTNYGAYQNFGSLLIKHPGTENAVDYIRELDIENAVAKTSYTVGKTRFTKEYFCSFPDKVCVINIDASSPRSLDLDIRLEGAHGEDVRYSSGHAHFDGKLDLVSYYAAICIHNDGGKMIHDGDGISVRGASSVTVYLKGATNYSTASESFTFPEELIRPEVETTIADAAAKPYATLKERHTEDYRSLFDRVSFQLEGTANTIPTDKLISDYNDSDHTNLFLEELYFHYGRYLMISCARGTDLPSNLQGIWNNSNTPPWASDMHSNINVQMNYWPAETTNLSELHNTFLNYIYDQAIVHKQWQRNAVDSGQSKGWTLYTENNIFGWHGQFMHNYVIANAWYCMHMWQHYRYTLDGDYLRRTAFPVMKTCCDYWMERLIQDRVVKDGTWVCPDEFSPEHGPKEDATAHSQQLLWDLFNNTLQAIAILGDDVVEKSFTDELKDKFAHLDKGLAIDGNGELKEWKYSENSAGQKYHRHLSHLMGLYPGNQISPFSDREIFDAAVRSLDARGDESTGWSMGWKINLWARALNGDRARNILNNALRLSETTGVDMNNGGVYRNLLDSHAPFQIDGNFGACAGIAEMLMQSHMGVIHILPALPSAWTAGKVRGLRAAECFEVDIDWEKGRAHRIAVRSFAKGKCVLHYRDIGNFKAASHDNAIEPLSVSDGTVEFQTTPGSEYIFTLE